MFALLWIAPIAAGLPQSPPELAHRPEAERCQAALARKVRGEVSILTIADFRRDRRGGTLQGQMNLLQRPAVRPGEMTPTHVIATRFGYRCRLEGRAAPKIRLWPVRD